MISTIVKINFLNLRRDKAAFALTFILPIVFFSIFAMIFGRMDRDARDDKIKIAVVDLDQTDKTRSFIAAMQKEEPLELTAASDPTAARNDVHNGKFAAAVVVLEGAALYSAIRWRSVIALKSYTMPRIRLRRAPSQGSCREPR